MSAELTIAVVENEEVLAQAGEILTLCQAVFPDFTEAYLTDRLSRVAGLALTAARDADGTLWISNAGNRVPYKLPGHHDDLGSGGNDADTSSDQEADDAIELLDA